MSHLQIISLFKNKSAAEVTADEIDFVCEFLEEHPELIDMLGGKTLVDEFLVAASETEDLPVTDSSEITESLYKAPARPWIFRITALLVLLLIGWIGWFGLRQAGFDFTTLFDRSVAENELEDPATATGTKRKESSAVSSDSQSTDTGWDGWEIKTANGAAVSYQPSWTFSDQGKPTSHMVPITQKQSTAFSIERRIEKDEWLKLDLKTIQQGSPVGKIEISINNEFYNHIPIAASAEKEPYLIPLHAYQDQQCHIQLTFTPGDDQEQLQWNRLHFIQQPPSTQWHPLDIVSIRSQAGTALSAGTNRIITAERGGPGIETYVAHVTSSLPDITAFRLEAFPDGDGSRTRPARTGRWHFMQTSFVLSSFRVSTAATKHEKMTGRYVKLIAKEERSQISLAEVQVFSGDQNIALQGTASQNAPDKRMGAAMAIDNRLTSDGYRDKDGKYARSISRTRGKREGAWWEVDLGKSYDIDRIVIHSPTAYSVRTNPFYVMVLDASRNPENDLAWESALISEQPSPSLELMNSNSQAVKLSTASTDILGHEDMVKDSLQGTPTGWNLPESFRQPQQAIFALEESTPTASAGFIVHLGHNMHTQAPTLGKFRLSATNAQPPFRFNPIGRVVWPYDKKTPPATVVKYTPPKAVEPPTADLAPDPPAKPDPQQADDAKAAQQALQKAEAIARQEADAARRLDQQKAAENIKIAQKKRQQELKIAQKKRQESLTKDRLKREADAKKRAEQLATRRKADAKRRADEAKKRADEAKRRADQQAARKKADA
ncbi:MAG: hypothetical protein OSB47_08230, partial [Pirellulaceae bacterium]|nr:hypothetical protein [Pirellulaceae bacterium]